MFNFKWLRDLRHRATGSRRARKSLLAFGERLENRSMLTNFVVTSTEDAPDSDPGDGAAQTATGETTLRAAVEEANATAGVDSIDVPDGLFELMISDAGDGSASNGSLDITDDVRIRGAGAGETILDASRIDALFRIEAGTTLRLEDLSLTGQPEFEEGVQPDGGIVELVNVTQTELPAGAVEQELLDPVELFLIGLAESEFEEEATADSSEETIAFPLTSIEPLRASVHHAELLETLFSASLLNERVTLPLSEVRLNEPEPVSRPDILLDSGLNPVTIADADPELIPGDNPHSPDEPKQRDPKRTATNDPELPRDTNDRREKIINSLFQQKGEGSGAVQPTSGKPTDNAPTRPARLPLNPVPLDKDGRLLLNPAGETNRPVPPPLPEPGDDSATSAIDAVADPVAAAAAVAIVPAGWKQRLRKRLRYWQAVVS